MPIICLMSLRALPLKILQGALPLDPTTFEKVDKTFNCHSYTIRKSFGKNFQFHITLALPLHSEAHSDGAELFPFTMIVCSAVHFPKAPLSITVTLDGTVISFTAVQLEKAPSPIDLSPSSSFTLSRARQPINADVPRDCTFDGMFILLSDLQLLNTISPSSKTVSGRSKVFRLVQ